MTASRMLWFIGMFGAIWFSVAHTFPPESRFYQGVGLFMGFSAIGNFIMAGAHTICEAIEKTKK